MLINISKFLKFGIHFIYKKQYITKHIFRKNIHILNLWKSLQNLNNYIPLIRHLIMLGGKILFFSNFLKHKNIIKSFALKSYQPFYIGSWIPGFISNFKIIRWSCWKAKNKQVYKLPNLFLILDLNQSEILTECNNLINKIPIILINTQENLLNLVEFPIFLNTASKYSIFFICNFFYKIINITKFSFKI